MTKREEIENRIEKLRDEAFMLEMKDYWNDRDYREKKRINNEIRELRKELENM